MSDYGAVILPYRSIIDAGASDAIAGMLARGARRILILGESGSGRSATMASAAARFAGDRRHAVIPISGKARRKDEPFSALRSLVDLDDVRDLAVARRVVHERSPGRRRRGRRACPRKR